MANARALTSASFMLCSGQCFSGPALSRALVCNFIGTGCAPLATGTRVANPARRGSRIWRDECIQDPASLSVELDLACVAPHLQAHEHFDIAGVAAGLRGGDATLAQCRRELRPFLLQLVARAFFISQTFPERGVQAQAVAHLRGRATGGLDVEAGHVVGNDEQQRATERKYHTGGKHVAPLACARRSQRDCARRKSAGNSPPERLSPVLRSEWPDNAACRHSTTCDSVELRTSHPLSQGTPRPSPERRNAAFLAPLELLRAR